MKKKKIKSFAASQYTVFTGVFYILNEWHAENLAISKTYIAYNEIPKH